METDKEERLRTTAENFVEAYLSDNPEFFRNHIDLFCKIVPPRQNKEGTRSVIECQNDVLRASLSVYELKEKDAKEDKLQAIHERSEQWQKVIAFGRQLCSTNDATALPEAILKEFMQYFEVKRGAIRLWRIAPEYQHLKVADTVPPWIQAQIASLRGPYVGENGSSEIAEWTNGRADETGGVFLSPLFNQENLAVGFICLAAPSPKPFKKKTHSEFIKPALELSEAALLRLQP